LHSELKIEDLSAVRFDASGLVPTIVQDAESLKVLMLAYMNEESLRQTFALGETVFFSRSRKELWHKGATSGNIQKIRSISIDCDGDTLLILADAQGPACHRNTETCFDAEI
jgi:phosphoribosyl-ATP pyrophosphohydrolase/phosphoribosyl-AMP cyclohydrolase